MMYFKNNKLLPNKHSAIYYENNLATIRQN